MGKTILARVWVVEIPDGNNNGTSDSPLFALGKNETGCETVLVPTHALMGGRSRPASGEVVKYSKNRRQHLQFPTKWSKREMKDLKKWQKIKTDQSYPGLTIAYETHIHTIQNTLTEHDYTTTRIHSYGQRARKIPHHNWPNKILPINNRHSQSRSHLWRKT